jgi:DNA-binding ferritin-like protein
MTHQFTKTLTIALALKAYFQLCHWGVRGMFFYQYHLLFGELYALIDKDIDSLAELANINGVFLNSEIFTTPVSLRSSSATDMVNDALPQVDAYKDSLSILCEVCERGTTNQLEDMLQTLDKVQYLLEASLPT